MERIEVFLSWSLSLPLYENQLNFVWIISITHYLSLPSDLPIYPRHANLRIYIPKPIVHNQSPSTQPTKLNASQGQTHQTVTDQSGASATRACTSCTITYSYILTSDIKSGPHAQQLLASHRDLHFQFPRTPRTYKNLLHYQPKLPFCNRTGSGDTHISKLPDIAFAIISKALIYIIQIPRRFQWKFLSFWSFVDIILLLSFITFMLLHHLYCWRDCYNFRPTTSNHQVSSFVDFL